MNNSNNKTIFSSEIMRKFRLIYQDVFSEQTKSFFFGEQWHGFAYLSQARKVQQFEFEEIQMLDETVQMQEFAEEISLLKKLKNIKFMGFLSDVHYEGKSSLAVSLARYAAKHFRWRVLLVDYTFTKSVLYRGLSIKPHFGMKEVFDGSIPLRSVVVLSRSDDFALLPSIGGFPKDHKNSSKVKIFIENNRHLFDFVIFDTPAYREHTHSMQNMAKLLDGVVLVKSLSTSTHRFQNLIKQLKKSEVNILGWVANNIST